MVFSRTERFRKEFRKLPRAMQLRALEAIETFEEDRSHPSLHARKMEGTAGIWEMRVSAGYRITFQFQGEDVVLRRIGTHDILRRE